MVNTDMEKRILLEARLHPFALPQDYIKLIFQSEFGPGHLIQDESVAQKRLYEEWEKMKNFDFEKAQNIGGGYIRYNIKGIDKDLLEKINTAFVTSANNKTGSAEGFTGKLTLFIAMAQQGRLPFDYGRAKQAVDIYLADGIRPTSHTEVYHRHYMPAYRVIREDLLE